MTSVDAQRAVFQRYRFERLLGYVSWPMDIAIFYFLWNVFGTPWWWWGLLVLAVIGWLGAGISIHKLESKMDRLEAIMEVPDADG